MGSDLETRIYDTSTAHDPYDKGYVDYIDGNKCPYEDGSYSAYEWRRGFDAAKVNKPLTI